MKIKRWIGVLLCMLLCVGMLPTMAFAANEADAWDGTADTSWYTGSASEYDINSAEALAGVSQLAADGNDFSGITLNLTTDVDLSGHDWTPIKTFRGTFNGGGHSVLNMRVALEDGENGFFGYLNKAVVKDINIEQADVEMLSSNSYFNQGILAGWANNAKVTGCSTTGSITADASGSDVPSVGGFIGSCKGNTSIVSCWSTADVTTTSTEDAVMLGGLVGQWENAANGAEIIDSYFGGTVTAAEATTSTAGILGAGLSFNGEVVLISGCVSYGQLNVPAGAEGNAVHIAALDEYGMAENCMWPDDGKAGVVRLVVDWSIGQAYPDPDFDETQCGQVIADFTDQAVIEKLNAGAQTTGLWRLGKNGYPVFSTQTDMIRADYEAVEAARGKVPADLSLFTDESVNALNSALGSVDENLSIDEQEQVNAMAKAIEDAIAALEYKGADYQAVDAAIEKANALNKDEYKDFSDVEVAIAAVVRDKNITEQTAVNEMAKAIEDAIAALEYKDADYSKVDEAIAKADALNPDDYTNFSTVEAAVNTVVRGKDITEQDKVDDMALAIENAIANLEKKPATGTPSDTDTSSPQTGDNSNIALWIAVMLAAGEALTGTVLYSRKRKYSR